MWLELKAFIRKLDHETSDLKFLNNQYVHKVRALEKDSKAKSERIQQLQEKNMQAVVQTPGRMKRLTYYTVSTTFSKCSKLSCVWFAAINVKYYIV